MIIGLTGKKGSGKDTAGSYLVEKYGFIRISFAEKLKQSAAACFGINPDEWEKWKNDPSMEVLIQRNLNSEVGLAKLRGEKPPLDLPHKRITVRQFLQNYGTEAHREIFGDDFWIWQALKEIDSRQNNYVITDCRFDNEAEHLDRMLNAVIIEIDRGIASDDAHVSESGVDPNLIRTTLDNSKGFDHLYAQLDTMVDVLQWKTKWA